MREFLLGKNEMLLGESPPTSLLLDFVVGQTVVIGLNIGFERSPLLFLRLFKEEFV
jgi:hypothetical protein